MSMSTVTDNAELLVVGLARNCHRTLRRDVKTLSVAARRFARVRFLVIESDSDDGTLEVLRQLREQMPDFTFISLGRLQDRHPLRTERIAVCRNRYLEELRSNQRYAGANYVLVADLDGANCDLTRPAVDSCWRSAPDWDVCAANQRDAYYDIWALRHRDWCPVDCWQQYRQLVPWLGREQALEMAVHSRMVRIPAHSPWIEVESAFGGLAFYKRHALLAANYVGLDDDSGEQICEHVMLHAQLRRQGLRIFINPALINANRTVHSARKRLHVRLRRRLESFGKKLLAQFRGQRFLAK